MEKAETIKQLHPANYWDAALRGDKKSPSLKTVFSKLKVHEQLLEDFRAIVRGF